MDAGDGSGDVPSSWVTQAIPSRKVRNASALGELLRRKHVANFTVEVNHEEIFLFVARMATDIG